MIVLFKTHFKEVGEGDRIHVAQGKGPGGRIY